MTSSPDVDALVAALEPDSRRIFAELGAELARTTIIYDQILNDRSPDSDSLQATALGRISALRVAMCFVLRLDAGEESSKEGAIDHYMTGLWEEQEWPGWPT